MNKIKSILMAFAFVMTIAFIGGAVSTHAQDTMMGKMGDKVQKTTKKVYNKSKYGVKRGYRVGYETGGKVWNGSKWVAKKSWKGGTWLAVKTANGTKWVYRKSKRAIVGSPSRRP